VQVTIVYLTPQRAWSQALEVPEGATVDDAVRASRLLEDNAELRGAPLDLGVFGHTRDARSRLRSGDRVEVYRPLTVDPKEARRIRAEIRRRRKGG
jgi:putative ubiquitin-RnfH superfamily antitoxin RatB of RatAB toxin-antitoxin module